MALDSVPSQGPGTSGSPARLFLNLTEAFQPVFVMAAAMQARNSGSVLPTLGMNTRNELCERAGTGPSRVDAQKFKAAARALSAHGPWEATGRGSHSPVGAPGSGHGRV